MTDVRIERDCLGEMEIPNDQYYGIQTHRMEKVSGTANLPVIFYPDMHYALAQIKKAAAIATVRSVPCRLMFPRLLLRPAMKC